ncbi:hypothetical protein Tco_0708250 [Tanacetum coccineum]
MEKSMENANFDEIVDFLTASPIRYALTVSPTIYGSYIKQFWSTAKIKTVNNKTQIHAKVIGKIVVIAESSVRRDLHFDDEDAVFNDEYDTPSHAKKVFANMRRQGKEFLGTVTPLFPSMLASQAVEGEGSGKPSEPQHTPTTASPSHVVPIPTVASSSHPKKTHKHRKTKRKVTKISQSSRTTTLIADETVHEERGDSVERAATNAASLDAEPAQTRFERLSKQCNDPPLSRFNTLRSGEDSMKLNELMEIYTRLSKRVLALENIKTAQNLEITNLKKRVKKLEKKKKARTPQLKRSSDTTAGASVSTVEPRTPPTITILIEDEDLTIAQTLIKMRSVKSKEKSKEKGISSETIIRPTRGEPEKPVKVKGKDQIAFDEEVARRLEAQMQAEYESLEREKQRRRKDARQIEEEDNLISWDNTQAMMETDYELAQRLQAEEQGELTIEERSKLFNEWIDSFVPMDSEVVEGSKSQAKGKDDAEKAELELCLEIVPRDDEAINVESLATKYPIVDWKTHILTEDKMYYEITRADGSNKFYKIFTAMLDDFDRRDVLDLYRSVKERFKTTSPEGYDRLLWGDLITLFELSKEDEIWKAQQDYTLISWRLYDSCGVHVLLMNTGITIHMMVEKKYPLTPEMLSRMLSGKLEVDLSTADEDCRKYSKSLLLLVVKLLLLVLVTTARRVSVVEFKRISLTGFRSCTSRSRYRSVSKQTTRISQAPTIELFDVDYGRISIVTVNTKEYHSDVLAIITRIMHRTLDNSL